MYDAAFIKMDIFFFITTAVVVVLGVFVALVLYYVAKIVRDVSEITEMVKKESQGIANDVREVRKDLKAGISTAKTYTKAVAGSAIVKGVAHLMEAFVEEKASSEERKKTRKRTTKKKKKEE